MAKRLTATSEGTDGSNYEHSDEEKAEIIATTASEIIVLEAEQRKVRESINEKKAVLKDLGLKMSDFNAQFRLAKLEPEDRLKSVADQAFIGAALKVGQQGDLFADLAGAEPRGKKAKRRSLAIAALDAAAEHLAVE